MERKGRSIYLDLIKAIAIILVVFGHCIQYGSGSEFYLSESYFGNWIFKCIYSFHMPLFALISGYLFYFSLSRRGSILSLKREIVSVLIPVLAWSASYYLVFHSHEIIEYGIAVYIKNLIRYSLTGIWFLWAVFWCAIAVILVNVLFKDKLIAYVVLLIALIFIPEKLNSYCYVYLYPYFVCGYLWNKHNLQYTVRKLFSTKWIIPLLCLLALWIGLLTRFNYNSYIYTTHISLSGKSWMTQLSIDLYRWFIGFIGSALILVGGVFLNEAYVKTKLENKFCIINGFFDGLSYVGRHTLGVYCISFYLNNLLYLICESVSYSLLLIFFETVFMLAISIFFDWLIGRNELFRRIYLGGR